MDETRQSVQVNKKGPILFIILVSAFFAFILSSSKEHFFIKTFAKILLAFGIISFIIYLWFSRNEILPVLSSSVHRFKTWWFLSPLIIFAGFLGSFLLGKFSLFFITSILVFICLLLFTHRYSCLPLIVVLFLLGFNLHHLDPAHGYDGSKHFTYLEMVAKGEPYAVIQQTKVGYLLPLYYYPPTYIHLLTGLSVGKSAQVMNFLYAAVSVVFLSLFLQTASLSKISESRKFAIMCIFFSAASISRLFAYVRTEPLAFMFITASAFFLIKAIEEKKFIFTYTSVVLGSIASAVRFVSFPYSVALFAYVSLTSILKKERYFLTGITIFSGACLIFLPYLFFHANPLYHISQNADAYSPDKFNSKYIFGWNFIPFFVEGQVKNYVQAFLHDWWGDWFRYYKHYNNSLMWKVHLLMGHVATIFIFASIVTYFIMKSMSISSLNAFKMATTEIDAFFTLYLLLWLAGIAYFSVSYANPGMYVLKAVYFAQGLPALIFLCLKGTEKLRINNTFFASMSLVFFIQSIYTHLLVP